LEEMKKIICCLCEIELEERKMSFSYLGNTFQALMQSCPKCGQIFIAESIVKGRMAEIEAILESK